MIVIWKLTSLEINGLFIAVNILDTVTNFGQVIHEEQLTARMIPFYRQVLSKGLSLSVSSVVHANFYVFLINFLLGFLRIHSVWI